jgi:uncharacterized membrane protein YjjP (DUF1212 family)
MTDDTTPRLQEQALLRALLIRLGVMLTRAGDSVDDIQRTLLTIAHANNVREVQIIVLPTVMLIQTDRGTEGHVELRSSAGPPLRLDQVSATCDVARRAERGEIQPAEALRQLDAVVTMRPTFGPFVRTFGHAAMTGGLALLLQPSWQVFLACVALGVLIGLAKLTPLPRLEIAFPVLAAFVVSTIVFAGAELVPEAANPLRTLIPPLVTFLPGAALTIATVELASDQLIAGASRLIYGIVKLLLLAVGIVAAASLVGTPQVLTDRPIQQLGAWAPWVGVLVFGIGVCLHNCAPIRSLPWILLVLYVTHAAQVVATEIFDAELSGFFGALVMTPVVFAVARTTNGPPSLVTFLPAFWLLVPGATSLIAIAEFIGSDGLRGTADLLGALGAILAITLGVLIGTALWRGTRRGWAALTDAFPLH